MALGDLRSVQSQAGLDLGDVFQPLSFCDGGKFGSAPSSAA